MNLRVVILGPDDPENEFNEVRDVLRELEQIVLTSHGIAIEIYHWSSLDGYKLTNASGTVTEKIDDFLDIKSSDFVIAIYSTINLGTQDEDGIYRTEKEIRCALEKRVSADIYFREMTAIDADEKADTIEIMAERKRYEEKLKESGVFPHSYTDTKNLSDQVRWSFFNFVLAKIAQKPNPISGILIGDRAGYLKKISELIESSCKQVLFTSTEMLTSKDSSYGDSQKAIIKASQTFSGKSTKLRHFGVVQDSPNALLGAIDLVKNVDNLVIRSKKSLDHAGVNYLISDGRHVVIRNNQLSVDKDQRYSAYFDNESLAQMFSQSFFRLWQSCTYMSKWVDASLGDEEEDEYYTQAKVNMKAAGDIESDQDWVDFLEKVEASEKRSQHVPNEYKEKIIPALKSYKFQDKTVNQVIDLYIDQINSWVSKNRLDVASEEAISEILIAINENKPIDYDQFSNVFFRQYFFANFCKTLHSLLKVKKRLNNRSDLKKILDIGGGGGASTLAISSFFEGADIKIDVVDRNEYQLETTEGVMERSSLGLALNFYTNDAYEFLSENKDSYDLVVASNFLCEAESEDNGRCIFDLMTGSLNEGGQLLIVERNESRMYEKILNHGNLRMLDYMWRDRRYKIPKSVHIKNKLKDAFEDTNKHHEILEHLKTEYTLRYGLYSK